MFDYREQTYLTITVHILKPRNGKTTQQYLFQNSIMSRNNQILSGHRLNTSFITSVKIQYQVFWSKFGLGGLFHEHFILFLDVQPIRKIYSFNFESIETHEAKINLGTPLQRWQMTFKNKYKYHCVMNHLKIPLRLQPWTPSDNLVLVCDAIMAVSW